MPIPAKTLFTFVVAATAATHAHALTQTTAERDERKAGPAKAAARSVATKTGAAAGKAAAAKSSAGAVVVAQPGAVLQPTPRPTLVPAESEHIARYDAAIAPVRNFAIGEEDASLLRDAIGTAAKGRLGDRKALRGSEKDTS